MEYHSEHYLEFDLKNFNRIKTYTTDNYFATTVAVNPHLEYFRKKYGIDYLIKKYKLFHITVEDI